MPLGSCDHLIFDGGLAIPTSLPLDSEQTWVFARIDVIGEPLRFPATARPGDSRILRVSILCHGQRTGGFHLGTDQISQRVAHLFGDCVQLGASFGLMTVVVGGNRLGEVLV